MERSTSFESWKELLRSDCAAHQKQVEFETLGDCVLRLFYDDAIDPTVAAIVDGSTSHEGIDRTTLRH